MGLFDEDDGDLITYWKTQTGITDLVGTGNNAKIWPDVERQGKTPPLIYFVTSGGDVFQRLGGTDSGQVTLCHTYCVGTTPSQANQLVLAVRSSTVDYRGTLGSTRIMRVRCTDPPDGGYEAILDGSDKKYWWRRIILRISHD